MQGQEGGEHGWKWWCSQPRCVIQMCSICLLKGPGLEVGHVWAWSTGLLSQRQSTGVQLGRESISAGQAAPARHLQPAAPQPQRQQHSPQTAVS